MGIFKELKRRNVIRVGLAYTLAAWVLLQIVDFALEVIVAPDWILQVFVLAAAIGLPIAVIFAWVFEMTPEGIKRESQIDRTQSITPHTGRKLDRVIIATLALAVVFLLADKFMLSPEPDQALSTPTVEEQPTATVTTPPVNPGSALASLAAKSVAVLPFIAMSQGADDEYFADGLTEEILNSLAQLPELLVTARTSAFSFKGQEIAVQEIAEKLGVRHIVEGSVRRSGNRLRVTAQLVRANDGFHLWSENYDSTSEDTIAVQEDIAEKIAVAMDVVMDEEKRQRMQEVGLRDVEAFIAFQKAADLYQRAHGQDDQEPLLHEANQYLEEVILRVPGYPPALAMHSDVYIHILMKDAGGAAHPGGEQEVSAAWAMAVEDYEAAIEHARSEVERNSLEIDLAFLGGNWRGAPSWIERFLAGTGCVRSTWLDPLALNLGYSEELLTRSWEFLKCDPLRAYAWWSHVRALLWAGQPETALEVATQSLEFVQHDWVTLGLVMSQASLGLFEQADVTIDTRLQSERNVLFARAFIAAMRGDRESAEAWSEKMSGTDNSGAFWELLTSAWRGDRERANELASAIDQKAFGPVTLSLISWWCVCGGPWEIEATPNFAAMIDETGRPWPPASPINLPLKDW